MKARAPGHRGTRRARRWATATALVAVVGAAGCAALSSATPARTFRLTYAPPSPSESPPLAVVVRVMPFTIAATYDRQPFVYRTGPYDVGFDHYNRWLAAPATMITDLIARDLAAAKVVRAVLQSPSALPSDYELSGHVETMEERDEDAGCTGHLRARVLLVRAGREGRSVVFQDSLVADEPCTRGNAESYVAAMSRATERLSTDIRAALIEAITASSR